MMTKQYTEQDVDNFMKENEELMSALSRQEQFEAACAGLFDNYDYDEQDVFKAGANWADANPAPEVLALVEALSAQGCSEEVYAERARKALSSFQKARGVK